MQWNFNRFSFLDSSLDTYHQLKLDQIIIAYHKFNKCENIAKEQCVSTNSLLSRLKLKSLDSVLKCNILCWLGHVKRGELYTRQILDLEFEEIEVAIVKRSVG